mmetsp:Transcript_4991/g.16053  ORF Transcript_4991/g.16053 Transcript_4991/m.16053 type:complete len:227 (+) Transcript_4991:76-756(+)
MALGSKRAASLPKQPVKSTPCTAASRKSTPAMCASLKEAPVRSALMKLEPSSLADVKSAPRRSARVKSALRTSARRSWAPLNTYRWGRFEEGSAAGGRLASSGRRSSCFRVAKARVDEGGADQVGAGEARQLEVAQLQLRVDELGGPGHSCGREEALLTKSSSRRRERGARKVSLDPDASVQRGADEHRLDEARLGPVGVVEACAVQLGELEVRPRDVGRVEGATL